MSAPVPVLVSVCDSETISPGSAVALRSASRSTPICAATIVRTVFDAIGTFVCVNVALAWLSIGVPGGGAAWTVECEQPAAGEEQERDPTGHARAPATREPPGGRSRPAVAVRGRSRHRPSPRGLGLRFDLDAEVDHHGRARRERAHRSDVDLDRAGAAEAGLGDVAGAAGRHRRQRRLRGVRRRRVADDQRRDVRRARVGGGDPVQDAGTGQRRELRPCRRRCRRSRHTARCRAPAPSGA